MTQTGGVLTDWVSLGVLASSVPRDVVDDAVAEAGKGARRARGKLPPHVMVYFVMALALFADDDYEEVAARLTQTLQGWDCWDADWEVPTRGGITQARQRLGPEPLAGVFSRVAEPVAGLDTIGAFFGTWRLMSVDGMEWDVPDTEANRAAFGSRGGSEGPGAYPKIRVVTVSECASHAAVLAAMGPAAGGKGGGEQSLARELLPRLEEDWLLIADRNFYCFKDWCTAADTGAALLWRVKSDIRLPVLELLPDGSYRSVLVNPKITWNKGLGKTPTTSVRRLISLFSRSSGLVDQIFFQWPSGKPAKAVMSSAGLVEHRLHLRELAAEHVGDDLQLPADGCGRGLGEDGPDCRGDHLRRSLGHLGQPH